MNTSKLLVTLCVSSLVAMLSAGCAKQSAQAVDLEITDAQPVAIENVPPAVLEKFKKQGDAAEVVKIVLGQKEGQKVYEATFREGKIETRLQIAEDGSLIVFYTASVGSAIREAAGAQPEKERSKEKTKD